MKFVAVIPAHMASVRFPGKILHLIHGLPMIEHVRRRALMCPDLSKVYVATCDKEIAEKILEYGGDVILTSKNHKNGTTRVAEAIQDIPCSHVLLLQGDEPLILPRHISSIISAIKEQPLGDAWNATGSLIDLSELDKHSFVKCIISKSGKILHCCRRSSGFSNFEVQREFTRKILGIIAYQKDFLIALSKMNQSPIETAEFIEQMRILENDFHLQSVSVEPSLPSVNEPDEVSAVLSFIENDKEQTFLLKSILEG